MRSVGAIGDDSVGPGPYPREDCRLPSGPGVVGGPVAYSGYLPPAGTSGRPFNGVGRRLRDRSRNTDRGFGRKRQGTPAASFWRLKSSTE